MNIEFCLPFEGYPIGKELLGGSVLIKATRHDWEADRVWAYAGMDGYALIPVHDDLAKEIRAHLMSQPSWVAFVDEQHAAHFPQPRKRTPRLVPAWAEGV